MRDADEPAQGSTTPARGVGARLPDGWRSRADPRWLTVWEPRRFDLGDGWTETVACGRGPTLLLLPPLPGFKEAWVGVAWRLAASHRVVTFDLRARPRGRDPWQDQLEDLDRVADALAPGRVALVGHSMGGALAQRWALRRPERVAALVLSSSFARVGGGSWRRRYLEQPLVLAGQRLLPDAWAAAWSRALAARGAWVYDPRCDEPVLALVRHAIRRLPPALAAARVRQAFAHDTRAALGELRCPTLVVVGERETAWARSASEDLAARIHGAELRVSPGVGHLHPLSASKWLTEAIGDFLGRLGDWAAG